MIGFDFSIPNEWGDFLFKILNGINVKNGIWKLSEEEILLENGNYLFNKKTYNEKDFKKLISSNKYYIIFANIQLYADYEPTEIRNYSDYEKSKCVLLLSIIDNIYVQVYSKDMTLLKQIEKNLINNKFQNIKPITKDSKLVNLFPTYDD